MTESHCIMMSAAILLFLLAGGIIWYGVRCSRGRACAGKLREQGLVDVHTHILPEVDDGSRSMEMTMELLQKSYEQGVRHLIATPHYRIGQNQKSAEEIKACFQKVRQMAAVQYPDLQLYLGSELFYSDGLIERLKNGETFPMADSRYVLLEYRLDEAYQRMIGSVIEFRRNGYLPVIAHVERYPVVIGSQAHLAELGRRGALLQMNAASCKKYIRYIRKGLIHLIGTDCHDSRYRSPDMDRAMKAICGRCSEEISSSVLCEAGRKLIGRNMEREQQQRSVRPDEN